MSGIWRDRLFFAVCCALPFLFIPKIFWPPFIGGSIGTMLVVYPLLAFYGYTMYRWKKGGFSFYCPKLFWRFIGAYAAMLLFTLVWGLYEYPYYDLIFNGPPGQIEKLDKLLAFFHGHGISVNEEWLLGAWFIARQLKGIFFECFYMFFCSYLIFCWYRREPLQASIVFERPIKYIAAIIIGYAAIEMAYFFGAGWAKSVLISVNPMLHAIAENWDWWPPLIWGEERIRSIFPEPSQFGMYAAMIVPFFWGHIIAGKRVMLNLCVSIIMMTLIFLSVSKTSSWLLLGEVAVFGVFFLCMRNWGKLKYFLWIPLCLGIAFSASLYVTSLYPSNGKSDNVYQSGVQDSISEVTNENSGSNKARFSIIKSDLRIWEDHWLLGVGSGLKAAYVPDYLMEKEKDVPEVQMWVTMQETKGVLKQPIGCTSEWTDRLARTGLVGFLAYLFPEILLLGILIKKRKMFLADEKMFLGLLPVLTAIAGVLASGFSGMMTTFHSLWILLGIAFSYVLQEK